MKKKIILALLTLILIVGIACPAVAATSDPRLVDDAQLLESDQQADILNQLNTISEKHRVDLVIVTADQISPKSPRQYADDFFDDNGYGYGASRDGVLLLISMENSDGYISTSGYGIIAFTDAGIEYIGEQIAEQISDGDYYAAFQQYVQLCDEFITAAKNGDPYDSHNLPKEPFNVVFSLIIALVIGFVVAFIVTSIMKGQLNTIRSQSGATDYVKPGSMNITVVRDMYLYRNVIRRPKPQGGGSSTHKSSSGRTHGGGGFKF